MRNKLAIFIAVCGIVAAVSIGQLHAQDWPMWGGTPARNMVSSQRGLPGTFTVPATTDVPAEQIDASKGTGLKWISPLGTQSYGNPTIAAGRVFVGTNNDPGRVPQRSGDAGIVLCLEESTGKLLWQLTSPKLKAGDVSDFEGVGNCSSPTVEGDRVYLVNNRCEVICLDVNGLSNGNDGDFKNEAQYIAGPGENPVELLPTDADILWVYDMRDKLGVFPNQMTSSSVLIVGEYLYVTTSNGRDWTGEHLPAPTAPAMICLDKQDGVRAVEVPAGMTETFKCNWSSPSFGIIDGWPMVFFGGDDGFCYAFDPKPTLRADGQGALRLIWKIDCNPPEYRNAPDGTRIKYGHAKGPSGILATPVSHDNKVYIAIGQDPSNGQGVGALVCIDAHALGDPNDKKPLWMNTRIGRSISTVAIADGLLYIADVAGKVYCIDAATGQEIWKHDAEGAIWGSPLVADGKVYIGTENSTLWVLAAGREKKVLSDVSLKSSMLSTPVAANGTLYVMTSQFLYAVGQNNE